MEKEGKAIIKLFSLPVFFSDYSFLFKRLNVIIRVTQLTIDLVVMFPESWGERKFTIRFF